MKKLRILNLFFITLLIVFFQNCETPPVAGDMRVVSSQVKPGCNNGGGYSGNNCGSQNSEELPDSADSPEMTESLLPISPNTSFSNEIQIRILAPVELECFADFKNIEHMNEYDWDLVIQSTQATVDGESLTVPRFNVDRAEAFINEYSILILDCELQISFVKNNDLPDLNYIDSVEIDRVEYTELDFTMPILRKEEK